MRMPTKREWALLALAPAIVLAALGVESEDRDGAAEVAEVAKTVTAKAEAGRAADSGVLDLADLRRDAGGSDAQNAFEAKSWYVPPPPPPQTPAKLLPPPPPSAPPLPFTYLGRYEDSAKPVIFLVRGDRILLVSAGDVIEGTYRVEGIAGAALGLTYLPLNIRQTLNIGNAG
ncbi:MAG: hypothetical protein HYY28_11100 [Betaproteobacteria bacterium]|nr:hypothetical protein [Betaproteobacteria bacterium]MBI2960853.1 hypothetical protein [Betaproteobacteria bacterium]